MPIRPKLGLRPSLAITFPSWLAVRGAEGLEYAGRAMAIKPVRDHYLKMESNNKFQHLLFDV